MNCASLSITSPDYCSPDPSSCQPASSRAHAQGKLAQIVFPFEHRRGRRGSDPHLAVSDELSGSGFRRKPRVQDADLPLPFFITTDIGRDSLPAGQARVAWRRDTALDLGDPVCARVDGRWRDEEAGRGTACSMLKGGRSCGMMMPLS